METNRRYNRQRFDDGYNDRDSNHYRRVDEDVYRGAYRFDNDSDHHNETTYDGFDLNDSMAQRQDAGNYRAENDQGGDYVYRRSRNTQDNNRHYNQDNNRPYSQGSDRHQNDDRPRHDNRNAGHYHDRYGNGNNPFNNSYAPDPYRNQNRDQNYGNMAGSLSFGYDGDYNSDPDYNRRYDPMSGEIRENFNNDNRRRHPDKYGPPDRFGINPDYDRY